MTHIIILPENPRMPFAQPSVWMGSYKAAPCDNFLLSRCRIMDHITNARAAHYGSSTRVHVPDFASINHSTVRITPSDNLFSARHNLFAIFTAEAKRARPNGFIKYDEIMWTGTALVLLSGYYLGGTWSCPDNSRSISNFRKTHHLIKMYIGSNFGAAQMLMAEPRSD